MSKVYNQNIRFRVILDFCFMVVLVFSGDNHFIGDSTMLYGYIQSLFFFIILTINSRFKLVSDNLAAQATPRLSS